MLNKPSILDPRKMHCGIMRTNMSDLEARITEFEKQIDLFKRYDRAILCIERLERKKNEDPEIYFHQPFLEAWKYSGNWNDTSQIFINGNHKWKSCVKHYVFLRHVGRTLLAVWQFDEYLQIGLVGGQGQFPEPSHYSEDFEPHYHRLEFNCRSTVPAGEVIRSSQMKAHLVDTSTFALTQFVSASGIGDWLDSQEKMQEHGIRVNPAIDDWLSVPSSVDIRSLDAETCITLFERSVDSMIDRIGRPKYVSLYVDLDYRDTQTSFAFQSISKLPPVWSYFCGHWAPERFDIYSLPKDPQAIRAYPLLRMSTYGRFPGLLFQLNLVHVRGNSFIEIQAYEDTKWFDVVSNFFGAPIDVWEGPIESRFGWYGDASTGRIVRHRTNSANTVPPETVPKLVFLVLPKYFDYGGDNFFESPLTYADPQGLFRTRAEAERFAESHMSQLMNGFELPVLTSQNADYELDDLPDENIQRLHEVLRLDEIADWRESIDDFQWNLPEDMDFADFLRLLKVTPYRIIETVIEDDVLVRKFADRIESGKLDNKLRREIAQAFELAFPEENYQNRA